ncbi:hypothetical protein Poly30_03530 [Planctomycetes bacterium Poly30]|uniref:Uncharacterized protein n=1 Tax=Saltatorellus ferox TaxID=2528018 RepID=A0A518EL87_9BACT|nr:hypothetical protein Poly30_03530 [Planctomycetes bacterium Poly30]
MLIKQEGRWCVVCAISSFEDEVRVATKNCLETLLRRAQAIQRELQAEHLTFSGILPGVMEKNDVPHDGQEAQTTVLVVADAIAKVSAQVGHDEDTPVILLGASGYIGTRLKVQLQGREVHAVDPKSNQSTLPESLRGQCALLVNVASRRALAGHLSALWEGLVLLNEVYPEPSRKERLELRRMGIPAFHVVGVEATAFPPFPGAYRGGAPCCAAIPSPGLRAVIQEL